MIDVVALGEPIIDFTNVSADGGGYPTITAHPGGAPANFLAAQLGTVADERRLHNALRKSEGRWFFLTCTSNWDKI